MIGVYIIWYSVQNRLEIKKQIENIKQNVWKFYTTYTTLFILYNCKVLL